jgi:small conductance mechanosensitive channel
MPKRKRKHANPNFTTSSKIAILIITSLMVLEEFSVEIGPILAAAELWAWHLVLEVNILSRYYFWSFIIIENQYRIGDVVKFDNAGGTKRSV